MKQLHHYGFLVTMQLPGVLLGNHPSYCLLCNKIRGNLIILHNFVKFIYYSQTSITLLPNFEILSQVDMYEIFFHKNNQYYQKIK